MSQCTHHGLFISLSGLVQSRTKENTGQKKNNLVSLDCFVISSSNISPAELTLLVSLVLVQYVAVTTHTHNGPSGETGAI